MSRLEASEEYKRFELAKASRRDLRIPTGLNEEDPDYLDKVFTKIDEQLQRPLNHSNSFSQNTLE